MLLGRAMLTQKKKGGGNLFPLEHILCTTQLCHRQELQAHTKDIRLIRHI